MNRSDRMKSVANAPRANHSGSFFPNFSNHDSVLLYVLSLNVR